MDRVQTNRVTMYKTVAGYLDESNEVWNGMAPFAEALVQFKDKLQAIDATAQRQETSMHGASGDRAEARDALEDVLFLICEALGVLAHRSGDNELGDLAHLTPTGIARLDNEELSHRATTVLESANEKKTELAAFHVTQANLDELNNALQTFDAAKARPRSAVVERSVQTESLGTLMQDAVNILRDEIDRLVNLFRRIDPEFVKGYRRARVIVDRTGRRSGQSEKVIQPSPEAPVN